jgi:hypothetical protein
MEANNQRPDYYVSVQGEPYEGFMQIKARCPKPDLPLYKEKDMEEYRDFIQRYLNFFDTTNKYPMDNARIALAASRFHKKFTQKWGFLPAA